MKKVKVVSKENILYMLKTQNFKINLTLHNFFYYHTQIKTEDRLKFKKAIYNYKKLNFTQSALLLLILI